MHVRVDVTRDEHVAGRVQHPRARADHLGARADVRDPLSPRGDVGPVELARVDVEQRPAAHVEIGGSDAASDVGETPTLNDGHSKRLYGCASR